MEEQAIDLQREKRLRETGEVTIKGLESEVQALHESAQHSHQRQSVAVCSEELANLKQEVLRCDFACDFTPRPYPYYYPYYFTPPPN